MTAENKISVRVPEEVRKYKARIAFGLTVRQIIASLLALAICVPLYFFGSKYIDDSILSWLIIAIAAPLVAVGFITINQMPFEKFIFVFLEYHLFFPQKRLFQSRNAWRKYQNMARKEEEPKGYFQRRKKKAIDIEASYERAVLLAEAEMRGDMAFDVDREKLLTVRTFITPGDKSKKKKVKDKKKAAPSKVVLSSRSPAQTITARLAADPQYVPSDNEFRALRQWNTKNEQRMKAVAAKKAAAKKQSALMKKRKTAKTGLPRSTQDTIPYIADYEEGLFETTPGTFSKVYFLKDINYGTSRYEEQENIFTKYAEFLNHFSDDASIQIVIDNRIVSVAEQEHTILSQLQGDDFDRHRVENNSIMRRQMAAGRNDIQAAKFLTVTIKAETAIEALLRFHRIDNELNDLLSRFGSGCKYMTTTERLSYYHDKFRKGKEGDFQVDYDFLKEQGISSKDYIAPHYFRFDAKHLQIDDEYYRVFYLANLPKVLSDDVLKKLSNHDFPVTVSLSVQPVAQEKAIRMVKRQLTSVEANKLEAEKNAIRSGYSPETIRHDITDAHEYLLELYEFVMNKNQKMFFVTITIMVHGSSLEELNENCATVENIVRTYTSQLKILHTQQEEGFKITLPFGYTPKRIVTDRMLTTESLAVFMPYSNQELLQRGGYWYGLNQISQNLVVINRTGMKTPSGFVLGTSGSGKSFATKLEMLNVLLNDNNTGVLVIDPENEYGDFCRAFGGSVVKISADSSSHINPLDMELEYGLDENDGDDVPLAEKKHKALTKKSNYLMSIIERMMNTGTKEGTSSLSPQQRSIVDRCIRQCYQAFMDNDFDPAYQPTLLDLQDELDKEKTSEAGKIVAESVEYFTRGSMNVFSHKTTVAVNERFVVFNVRDLGDQLRQIALTIVFDFIWNRMIENKNKGVRTYCYCDEIHVMFQSSSSADFLKQLYKRGRKYGLCITGLTQNVSDLLSSEQARGMIGNSDYVMMLNQHSEDLRILAEMLGISDTLMGYVIGAEPGSGLIFAENVIVPFINRYPSDSYIYKLMSTKFGEGMTSAQVNAQIKQIMEGGVSSVGAKEKPPT